VTDRRTSLAAAWKRYVSIAAGFLILLVLLATPVKGWLNGIPHLWQVVYPLTLVFAGALVVSSLRSGEHVLVTAKWSVLLVAALCATLSAFGAGYAFFVISRWAAIIAIVAEVLLTLILEPRTLAPPSGEQWAGRQ